MVRDLKRALLAAGMVLALSSFTVAHDEHSSGSDIAQRGNQQGYSDGFQHGREDRDRGMGYDYQGDEYQRADRGYDPNYGDRDQFVSAYREGYRAGYDDGYNGRNGRSDDSYGRDDGYGRDDRYGHDGDYDRDDRRGPGYSNPAYDMGYRDGTYDARKDLREHKSPDLSQHHSLYRRADHGYSWSYGDKEAYRQQYRLGYEAAYRETFGPRYRSGRYPGGYTTDVAYNNGYRDGMADARKDLRERKSPDLSQHHDLYRDADRGYYSSYGDREAYRQQYRRGYEAAYDDVYRGPGR